MLTGQEASNEHGVLSRLLRHLEALKTVNSYREAFAVINKPGDWFAVACFFFSAFRTRRGGTQHSLLRAVRIQLLSLRDGSAAELQRMLVGVINTCSEPTVKNRPIKPIIDVSRLKTFGASGLDFKQRDLTLGDERL